MRTIPLSKGYVALVDDEDYAELIQYEWRVMISKHLRYAVRTNKDDASQPGTILMHRQLMGFPVRLLVDHRDRDGLNCQRENLRLSTQSQNAANSRKHIHATSRLKGTYFHKAARKWMAKIRVNWKYIYLGLYLTEEEAHEAYYKAAKQYFGEFARSE